MSVHMCMNVYMGIYQSACVISHMWNEDAWIYTSHMKFVNVYWSLNTHLCTINTHLCTINMHLCLCAITEPWGKVTNTLQFLFSFSGFWYLALKLTLQKFKMDRDDRTQQSSILISWSLFDALFLYIHSD